MGESGWTAPLPLESNANTEAPEDFNIKPVLIRARIPEWGTVHEITARLELVGNGFERTLVSQRWPSQLTIGLCLHLLWPWSVGLPSANGAAICIAWVRPKHILRSESHNCQLQPAHIGKQGIWYSIAWAS